LNLGGAVPIAKSANWWQRSNGYAMNHNSLSEEDLDRQAAAYYGYQGPPSPLDPLIDLLDDLGPARARLRAATDDLRAAGERLVSLLRGHE
jgi:hypothetical protein